MQISLIACRRKLQEATEARATLLEQFRAAPQFSDPDFIRLNKQLEEYSSRLDEQLLKHRQSKWNGDGISPKPQPCGSTWTLPQRTEKIWTHTAGKKRHCRTGRSKQKSTGKVVGRTAVATAREELKNGDPEETPTGNSDKLLIERTVINLSSSTLSLAELPLLQKGLTFFPTAQQVNRLELTADLHDFYRKLCLHDYLSFADKPHMSRTEESALQCTSLRRQSYWHPPKGSYAPEVNVFANVFHASLREALPSQHSVGQTDNLSKEERLVLTSLQNRQDIMLRPADKGSAVVVVSSKDYDKEVLRLLSDETFYQRLKKDPTPDHQSKIRATVRNLQDKGSINQRTAQDLVETKVKSAHFYILPKIHNSLDNPPGRPIVSSNQCPTERISAFVDLHLKPLVSALPSYIRDTKDFLFKLESLPRFHLGLSSLQWTSLGCTPTSRTTEA